MSKAVIKAEDAPLLSGLENDGLFLLLPEAELKKRCKTAASLRRVERLREAVSMLLPTWPLRDISKRLGISTETLIAFAGREAEKVGTARVDLKEIYRSKSLRWAALAQLKEGEAPFNHLVLASKLMADIALSLDMTGQVGGEKAANEDVDHQAAAAAIRARMEELLAEDKGQLPANAPVTNGLRDCRATDGAGPGTEQPAGSSQAGQTGEGGGGGSAGGGEPNHPDGFTDGKILPKGSSQ